MGKKLATLSGTLIFLWLNAALAQTFTDVAPGHWAYEAVERLAGLGIMQGFPDGTFGGNRPLSRFEIAVILHRTIRYLEALTGAGAMRPVPPEELAPSVTPPEEPGAEPQLPVGVPPQEIGPRQLADLLRLAEELAEELRQLGMPLAEVEALCETLGQDVQELRTYRQAHSLSGYIQFRGLLVNNPGGHPLDVVSYRIPRARVALSGDLTPKYSYEIEADFLSEDVTLKDLILRTRGVRVFGLELDVQAGQFYLPFGIEGPTSSQVRLSPERAAFAAFRDVRDVGVMVSGQRFEVGLFNGSGTGVAMDTDRKKDLVGTYVITRDRGLFIQVSGTLTIGKKLYKEEQALVDLAGRWRISEEQHLDFEYMAGRRGGDNTYGGFLQLVCQPSRRNTFVLKYDLFNPDTLTVGEGTETLSLGWLRYQSAPVMHRLWFSVTKGRPLSLTWDVQVSF